MLILQIFLPANAITNTLNSEKCKSVVFLPDYIEQALFKYAASPHSTCICNYRSNGFLYIYGITKLKHDWHEIHKGIFCMTLRGGNILCLSLMADRVHCIKIHYFCNYRCMLNGGWRHI
jgi:hypothetical protein